MKKTIALIVALCFLIPSAYSEISHYDFGCPIYGEVTSDLSAVSNFLELAKEHDIYIPIKEITVTHTHDDYEWIGFTISDQFWILYIHYYDDSLNTILLETPISYRPKNQAMSLLLESFLSLEEVEADRLLNTILYNVIGGSTIITKDNIKIDYTENKWFQSITIYKYEEKEE